MNQGSSYDLMPTRDKVKTDGSFDCCRSMNFFTNYYEVQIDKGKNEIFQYSFQLPEEEVPDDSGLYFKAIKSLKNKLKENFGLLNFKGKMFWGTQEKKGIVEYPCKFTFDQNDFEIDAEIKLIKKLNIRDLMESSETKTMILQVLNIDMKQKLKSLKMYELGKSGNYYSSKRAKDKRMKQLQDDSKLSVIRGFKFTLVPLSKSIYLQIDVCSRILQSQNLLQIFNGHPREQIRSQHEDSIVITRYGIYRTYKILQIDYHKSPNTQFYNSKKGVQMTYQAYYKEAYGLEITNPRQPLLKVVGHLKKEIKNGKIEVTPQYIYLIPEFVSPTGMRDDQKKDFETMKRIAPFTKLTPNQRVEECQKIVDKLNDNEEGMIKIGDPQRMEGYVLKLPKIKFGQKRVTDGITGKQPLRKAAKINDWIFVYSHGKNFDRDDNEADDAVDIIRRAGKRYGVTLDQPGYLCVEGRMPEDWISMIKGDVKKNSKPELIVCFFNNYEADDKRLYSKLKRFLVNQIKVPNQIIKRRTLKSKGAMSAAGKINIQISSKVGGVHWQVLKSNPYFEKKKLMYGGLSISKGKKNNTLAFVGTTSNDSTKIYSQCKVGIKRKEEIPSDILNQIFKNWAKAYFRRNEYVPDIIILYREGLSDAQVRIQVEPEIEAIRYMINQIKVKTKQKNFKPQIYYLTVNKKINSRFYYEESRGRNKSHPYVNNPEPGSLILDPMSKDDAYDFHLVPQRVNQGTCTPTHYTVAFARGKMPQEALIEFTYEQCYNYSNWQGPVRVPGCLQSTDKLAKLVGEYIQQDVTSSEIIKLPYFL